MKKANKPDKKSAAQTKMDESTPLPASKGTKRKLIEDDAPESAGPEPPMGIGKEIVDHRNAASTSRASGSTSKIVFPKIASVVTEESENYSSSQDSSGGSDDSDNEYHSDPRELPACEDSECLDAQESQDPQDKNEDSKFPSDTPMTSGEEKAAEDEKDSEDEFYHPIDSEEVDSEDEQRFPEVTKTDKDVFGNLSELNSELNLNEQIYPGCNTTVLESLTKLSIYGKQFNLSNDEMSNFFKVVNMFIPKNTVFSHYNEDNLFEKMAEISHKSDKENIQVICIKCKAAHENRDAQHCPNNCKGTTFRTKFVVHNLESLLRSMFETRGFAQILESQVDCFSAAKSDLPTASNSSGSLYDLQLIHNSKSFKHPQYEKDITVWSHLFAIRNLPPSMRPKYILAGALISSEKDLYYELSKFYFNETIKPLLEKGLKWRHPVSKMEITSKISIVATTTGDPQVERALYQLDALHACKICDIECSTFEMTSDHGPRLKKGQTVRGYLHKAGPLALRTQTPRTEQEDAAEGGIIQPNETVNPAALFLSKDCVIVANSSPDYFDSCVMGVAKKWTLHILNAERKEHINFIGQYGKLMGAQMKQFKTPSFVNVPDLNENSELMETFWKPHDYRGWLLFFSLPCLLNRTTKYRLKQHGLLVESIYLLLKSEVLETDRKRAEVLLTEYSKVMSKNNPNLRSMNLHKHLHFAESVKHLGPLWEHSSYAFFEANDIVKTTVERTCMENRPNCLKPVGQLIYAIDTLNDILSLELLGQVTKMKANPEKFRFTQPVSAEATVALTNEAVKLKIGLNMALSAFGICSVKDVEFYSRWYVNTKNQKQSSYFVAYEDPRDKLTKHALVIVFFMCGNKKYFTGNTVLLKEAAFKTSLGCDVSHIRKFSVDDKSFVCEEVKCLRKPLYHMDDLLAEPPNMFELK